MNWEVVISSGIGTLVGGLISGLIGYRVGKKVAKYTFNLEKERIKVETEQEQKRQKESLLNELLIVRGTITKMETKGTRLEDIRIERLQVMYQAGNIPQLGGRDIQEKFTRLYHALRNALEIYRRIHHDKTNIKQEWGTAIKSLLNECISILQKGNG